MRLIGLQREKQGAGGRAVAVLELEGEADKVIATFRHGTEVQALHYNHRGCQQGAVGLPGGRGVNPLYREVVYADEPDASPDAPFCPVQGEARIGGVEAGLVPKVSPRRGEEQASGPFGDARAFELGGGNLKTLLEATHHARTDHSVQWKLMGGCPTFYEVVGWVNVRARVRAETES